MPDSIPLSTVKQLMQQQRDDFNSIIETVMRSFNERHDALQKTVVELKISLEFTQKEVESLKTADRSGEAIDLTQQKVDDLVSKIDYLENQSRRNNIIIDGILESPSETWSETETKVQDLLQSKLSFSEKPHIERAHRIGSHRTSRHRPVVVKFQRYKDRESALKNARNLKGSAISIRDDVSERVQASRKRQLDQLKEAKRSGKVAYFSLDRLIIKERVGVPNQVNHDADKVNSIRPNTRSQSVVD